VDKAEKCPVIVSKIMAICPELTGRQVGNMQFASEKSSD
jgi:hypothetical protein